MMKIIVNVFKVSTMLFCGVLVLFMLNEVSSNKQELKKEKNYATGNSTQEDRRAITNTLTVLQQGYSERNVSKVDYYLNKTIDTTAIVILGTNPDEVFIGKEGAHRLFYGDWAYWGDVKLNLEKAHISRLNNTAYIALTGTVKIDIWKISFPLRITGVMVNQNSKWLINKLQFQYDLNTNYIIFGMIASLLVAVSFTLLVVMVLIRFISKRLRLKKI